MRDEIIAETVAKLKAERDNKIMEQIARVQNDVIMPKFAEFDAKRDASISAEEDRHSRALITIQNNTEAEKKAFEDKVQATIAKKVEESFHYDADIAALEKLLNS
jgi:hypothetical protein